MSIYIDNDISEAAKSGDISTIYNVIETRLEDLLSDIETLESEFETKILDRLLARLQTALSFLQDL